MKPGSESPRHATAGHAPWPAVAGAGLCLVVTAGSLLYTQWTLAAFAAAAAGTLLVRAEQAHRTRYRVAADAAEPSGTETVEDLSGWKVAEITGEVPRLTGLLGEPYHVEDTMVCLAQRGHTEPQVRCTCGFHAFTGMSAALRELRRHEAGVLLQVDGDGLAIEHEHGWRAERQRVLRVWVRSRCRYCKRRDSAGVACAPGSAEWRASCGRCGHRWDRHFVSLAELRQRWATEVDTWHTADRMRVR